MRWTKEDILDTLELESEVLTKGGYAPSVREPRTAPRYLRDSVTCLNHAFVEKRRPCSECLLIRWVPEDRRGEEIPCHHIPLDEKGRTLASFEGCGTARVEAALLGWIDRILSRHGTPADQRG